MTERDGQDFLEYLALQDSPEMLTKSELLERVRKLGGRISDRQLTFYASERLIPKAVRVGSRAGAYPRIVANLLAWISRARDRGLSIDAIRELVPVWRVLHQMWRSKRLDLAEFEFVARESARSPESVHYLPSLLPDTGPCIECLRDVTLVLKDGREIPLAEQPEAATIGFLFAEMDEGGQGAEYRGFSRMAFPIDAKDPRKDPTTVIVGIPHGIEPPEPFRPHDDLTEQQTLGGSDGGS